MVLFDLNAVSGSAVRANGAVLVPLVVLIRTAYPLRLGVAIALEPYWGQDSLWWSLVVGAAASFTLAVTYYRWERWRELHLLKPPASQRALRVEPITDDLGLDVADSHGLQRARLNTP